MKLSVTLKSVGSRRCALRCVPFALAHHPQTVAELIAESLRSCVAAYNTRHAQEHATPLRAEEIEHLHELGKIAFGLHYGGEAAEEPQAIATALQAYEDGLFRLFIGGEECGGLASAVSLHEDDCLTFIRLTMLTGGMF